MAPHKYTIGQKVDFRPEMSDGPGSRGSYTITRALPGDAHDRTYRARGTQDGHERVLREKQLTPAPAGIWG
ncbi:hypothetical protein ACE7GA_25955 [Roseomonas sp. CCTCC AB2023176]|uniref:hypothetical protein n=1 Tax=Roseomonas sp. CCTCC AB2023176 TaxID=3342640 RepID=UPI0035E16F25